MRLQKIAVADIVMDKPNAEDRTFSKDFAISLAKSIESDGLLHEPIVRPIPDQPGKFKELTGRHRIYAMGKVLKWEEIPCKIAPAGMTEDEAQAIEDAENLWRLSLDDAQTKKALIRWQKIYDAKHPAASGKGAAQKQAAIVKQRVAEAEANGQPVDAKQVAAEVAAENKPFAHVLRDTLKVSAATAGRLARIAKHLEPEQIDVLEKHKVTNHVVEQLCGLGSQELIVKAINLIASGMDHAEAVRQAGKPAREAKAKAAEKKGAPTKEQAQVAANARKAAAKAEAAPKPARDKELTDEEWLAQHCDSILKLLKHKVAFKADAILYRRLKDSLPKIRNSAKKPLSEAKRPANGGFFGALVRVVKAAHPSNWLVCGGCNGQGYVLAPGKDGKEEKQTCTQCHGAAYKLKLED